MTLPTLPTGINRPPKFAPDGVTWARVERAANFGPLSDSDRSEIARYANLYLQGACEAERGIAFRRLAAHNTKLLKHVQAIQNGLDQGDRSQESRADLANREFLRVYIQQLGQALNRGAVPAAFDGDQLRVIAVALSDLDQALTQLSVLFDNPDALGGWTQPRCTSFFLMRLAVLYERKSGQRMSLRKDTQDLEVASPFVAFARAIWQSLPAYNKKHTSLTAMTKRIEEAHAELLREKPTGDVEIISRD